MPDSKQPQLYNMEEDEITLKELILKVQEFFWEAVRYWWIIALFVIPIIGFMLYRAFTTPPTYRATLTFMLNEDEGSGMGGVSAILGQFGLGGGSRGKVNLNKLLELSKSRRIVQMALFEKVSIKGENDFLANHIIFKYDYHEKWKENTTELKGFLFSHDSIPSFSRVENNVLKRLHQHILGTPNTESLASTSINDDSGIMTLLTNTNHEELSICLAEILYQKLSKFYIDKTIEKQQKTYELFKAKTDSIQQALDNTQYRLLRFKDTNRSLTLRQYEAEEIKLQQEVQKLILAYGEAYKNLEVADFSLKSSTPFIQMIDLPIAPIKPKKESKLKALLMGFFLGGFLGLIFVFGRKVIRDTML